MPTVPTLDTIRDNWLTALNDLSSGKVKSYKIGDRFLTYNDLKEIRETIDWCNGQIASATAGGVRNLVG